MTRLGVGSFSSVASVCSTHRGLSLDLLRPRRHISAQHRRAMLDDMIIHQRPEVHRSRHTIGIRVPDTLADHLPADKHWTTGEAPHPIASTCIGCISCPDTPRFDVGEAPQSQGTCPSNTSPQPRLRVHWRDVCKLKGMRMRRTLDGVVTRIEEIGAGGVCTESPNSCWHNSFATCVVPEK